MGIFGSEDIYFEQGFPGGLVLKDYSKAILVTGGRVGALAALLLLLINSAFSQQPSAAQLPFSAGEELIYQGEFTKGLLHGIDVAEFRFKVGAAPISGRGLLKDQPSNLQLMGDVVSKGLFVRIAGFHFHEHVESTVDTGPFTALRTSKLEEQGKRIRASEAVFDHEARKVTWTERDPNQAQPPRTTAVDFSEPIQDILTVIYFLRTQKLEVGKTFDVPLSDSGRVFRFAVKVVERKQIKTVLGRVNAVRIEPSLFGDTGLVQSRGSLSIWITDDNRRLPVKAQLKVDLGTFDIKLKKIISPQAARLH